jgi:hypothetical protein
MISQTSQSFSNNHTIKTHKPLYYSKRFARMYKYKSDPMTNSLKMALHKVIFLNPGLNLCLRQTPVCDNAFIDTSKTTAGRSPTANSDIQGTTSTPTKTLSMAETGSDTPDLEKTGHGCRKKTPKRSLLETLAGDQLNANWLTPESKKVSRRGRRTQPNIQAQIPNFENEPMTSCQSQTTDPNTTNQEPPFPSAQATNHVPSEPAEQVTIAKTTTANCSTDPTGLMEHDLRRLSISPRGGSGSSVLSRANNQDMASDNNEEQKAKRQHAMAAYAEYMQEFERNRKEQEMMAVAQDDEDQIPGPSTSYAAAAATPPARPYFIFETTTTKKPINTATYLWLRAHLKQALLATHCAAQQFGLDLIADDELINFSPLPFDQELRGFPILLKNKASIDWVKETLTVTNFEGAEFRLWAPGEDPGTQVMSIYLNSDFDGVSTEFLVRTILLFNSGIPLKIDMIHNEEIQYDRCPPKPTYALHYKLMRLCTITLLIPTRSNTHIPTSGQNLICYSMSYHLKTITKHINAYLKIRSIMQAQAYVKFAMKCTLVCMTTTGKAECLIEIKNGGTTPPRLISMGECCAKLGNYYKGTVMAQTACNHCKLIRAKMATSRLVTSRNFINKTAPTFRNKHTLQRVNRLCGNPTMRTAHIKTQLLTVIYKGIKHSVNCYLTTLNNILQIRTQARTSDQHPCRPAAL